MKYLKQFWVILIFGFLGELCRFLLPFPIPASIYGMVLLFLALSCKIVKLEQFQPCGAQLVSWLAVLFVPPMVGLMDYWELIRPNLLALLVITLATTVCTFACAGLVTQWLAGKKEDKDHD